MTNEVERVVRCEDIEMGDYTDKDFNPPREFWHAMVETAVCDKCNYQLNGTLYVWKLLDSPQHFECVKCGHQWSIAIPRGENNMRERIEKLLDAEKRYYKLRDQLRETVNLLHGRT